MGRANKRKGPRKAGRSHNVRAGRAQRIASRHGLQSFADPYACLRRCTEGSVILTLDSFGNLGGTVFLVMTPEGRGKVMPIEELANHATQLPLQQAGELLNLVKQYRAEQAGMRGRA